MASFAGSSGVGAGDVVDEQLDGDDGAVGADALHSSLTGILASLGFSLR